MHNPHAAGGGSGGTTKPGNYSIIRHWTVSVLNNQSNGVEYYKVKATAIVLHVAQQQHASGNLNN